MGLMYFGQWDLIYFERNQGKVGQRKEGKQKRNENRERRQRGKVK